MEAVLAITITLLLASAISLALLIVDRARLARRASRAEHDAIEARALHSAQQQAHAAYTHQLEQRLAERDAALRDTFAATASQALRSNSESFLSLANERLAGHLKPVTETLKEVRDTNARIERDRHTSFGALSSHLQAVQDGAAQLRKETGALVSALRKPQVRGRYGEIQLRRVIELAGMRDYCDFDTQATAENAEGLRLRPDCIVRLPNGRCIAIDAKNNTEHYLAALESPDHAEAHLKTYARAVRDQALALSRKEYWDRPQDTLDLVVMFIPGDQFVDAALQYEPKLLDFAAQHKVLIASPASLIGLLRAIWVGWREKSISDHAEALLHLGRQFHDRAAVVLEHVDAVGRGLTSTTAAYNKLVGSVDNRLMPTLRRFTASGAASSQKPLETPRRADGVVTELKSLPQRKNEKAAPPSAAPPSIFPQA